MTAPDPEPDLDLLASPADLALVSLGTLSTNDANDLLGRASADARSFCRWWISEKTYDLTLDCRANGMVLLPALRVTTISAVTVDGELLTVDDDYTWSSSGVLEGNFPIGRRNINVKFTAGFDPVPRDVAAAVCGLAARKIVTKGGFSSQRIGSLALSGSVLGEGVDDPESVLSRYRLP